MFSFKFLFGLGSMQLRKYLLFCMFWLCHTLRTTSNVCLNYCMQTYALKIGCSQGVIQDILDGLVQNLNNSYGINLYKDIFFVYMICQTSVTIMIMSNLKHFSLSGHNHVTRIIWDKLSFKKYEINTWK